MIPGKTRIAGVSPASFGDLPVNLFLNDRKIGGRKTKPSFCQLVLVPGGTTRIRFGQFSPRIVAADVSPR